MGGVSQGKLREEGDQDDCHEYEGDADREHIGDRDGEGLDQRTPDVDRQLGEQCRAAGQVADWNRVRNVGKTGGDLCCEASAEYSTEQGGTKRASQRAEEGGGGGCGAQILHLDGVLDGYD